MTIKINPFHPQKEKIAKVAQALKRGGVIAYPTDTIYGLGCDIFNKKAVQKIYQIKKRVKNQPLSFICYDLKHVSQFAQFSDFAYKIMKRCLPGPYTFLLKAMRIVPKMLIPKRKTVGIRIPDNKICIEIVKALGNPIITTSINVSGETILAHPQEIEKRFGKQIDLIIDAGPLASEPSTVIDLTTVPPTIIRKGRGSTRWLAG